LELIPFNEYTSTQIDVSMSLDGPCLLRDGSFGLIVSLRGKDGGAMPSPSELQWRRDVPEKMRETPSHLFLRRDREERSALYLGQIVFVRTGRPARDGFKILFRLREPPSDARWQEFVAAANVPPPPTPEEAISALTLRSTTADRVGAMRLFVERWYGMTAGWDASIESSVITNVPGPLRQLYALTATRAVFGQNTLVRAAELTVEDGKVVFYVENQGCCTWAIEPGSDDPPVFVRFDSADPWFQEAPTLSGFLIQAVIFETVLCAPFFGASTDCASASELRRLRRRLKPVPLPPWAWNGGTEFFASNGIVGFASPNSDLFTIELAAHDREPFEQFEELFSEWPNVGF
jgi:hypothetical protein